MYNNYLGESLRDKYNYFVYRHINNLVDTHQSPSVDMQNWGYAGGNRNYNISGQNYNRTHLDYGYEKTLAPQSSLYIPDKEHYKKIADEEWIKLRNKNFYPNHSQPEFKDTFYNNESPKYEQAKNFDMVGGTKHYLKNMKNFLNKVDKKLNKIGSGLPSVIPPPDIVPASGNSFVSPQERLNLVMEGSGKNKDNVDNLIKMIKNGKGAKMLYQGKGKEKIGGAKEKKKHLTEMLEKLKNKLEGKGMDRTIGGNRELLLKQQMPASSMVP